MADFRLAAEPRTEFGKGSARRTRRAGRVPGVLYGHGQDVQHLSVPAREFAAALRNGGSNVLLTVTLGGKDYLALTKAVQRDPLTRVHEHVDLLVVRRGEKVTVDVSVFITGEPAPDTLTNHELNTVSIEADAAAIPESFELDVTGREVGQGITAGEIELPAGSTLITDPDAMVIGFLAAPTAAILEAEMEAAEAEAGIERDETDEEVAATAASEGAGAAQDDSSSDES